MSPSLTFGCRLDSVMVLDSKSQPSVYLTTCKLDTLTTQLSPLNFPLFSTFTLLRP